MEFSRTIVIVVCTDYQRVLMAIQIAKLAIKISRSPRFSVPVSRVHVFLAVSGPVIRLSSGKVEATIPSETARPPNTAAQ